MFVRVCQGDNVLPVFIEESSERCEYEDLLVVELRRRGCGQVVQLIVDDGRRRQRLLSIICRGFSEC